VLEHFGQRHAEIAGANESLARALEDSASTSATHLVEVNSKLKQDIGGLLEGMAQAHRSLLGLMNNAEENINRLDAALAPKVEAFASAIEGLRQETQRFSATGHEIAGGVEVASRDLNAQAEKLSASFEQIAQAQADIDQAIEARLQGVRQLHEAAEQRQTAFEQELEKYDAVIGQTLAQAEGRAREVGAFLAEATAATAGASMKTCARARRASANARRRR
jgi:chromosome segregation ATPase